MSGFAGFMTPAQSAAIFDLAAKQSVIQQLARQIPLGAAGVSIPITTGKLAAAWVAEGGQKPASAGTMALKLMTPKKLAVISIVSAEVVRANPGNYMSAIREQVAEAFALAFDAAAAHGTATPFTTWLDQSTKAVITPTATAANGGIFADINAGLTLLVAAGKKLTGFALDDRFEPMLNGAVDTTGRPIFIDSPLVDNAGPVRAGRLLGRPAFIGGGIYKDIAPGSDILGYGGDFSQAAWGTVGGITYDISTEATATIGGSLVSLWENNLVGIRAEAEYGWLVNDTEAFVKYVATATV